MRSLYLSLAIVALIGSASAAYTICNSDLDCYKNDANTTYTVTEKCANWNLLDASTNASTTSNYTYCLPTSSCGTNITTPVSNDGGKTYVNRTFTTVCPSSYTCNATTDCQNTYLNATYSCGNLVWGTTGNYTSTKTCQSTLASKTVVIKGNTTLSFVAIEDASTTCNADSDCKTKNTVCAREVATTTTTQAASNLCVDTAFCLATETFTGQTNNYYCKSSYCTKNDDCTSTDSTQCCAKISSTLNNTGTVYTLTNQYCIAETSNATNPNTTTTTGALTYTLNQFCASVDAGYIAAGVSALASFWFAFVALY